MNTTTGIENERARPFDAPVLSEVDSLRVVARHDAMAQRRRHDAGFSQGLEDGHRAAAAEVAAAIADHRTNAERLASLCSALDAAVAERRSSDERLLADIERSVIETSLQIAELVIGREVADQTTVVDAIRRSLELRPRDEQVVVRLHPDDLGCAAEALEAGLLRDASPLDGVEFSADPGVAPGGCVVDGASLHVDGQLATAFERVAETLRDAR